MFETMMPALSPDTIVSCFALAIGFALAGLCASGYRLVANQLPSFQQLEKGPMGARFVAVPVLIFAAPFIIMRNTIRGRRIEGRRLEVVMIATVIAGVWSLLSGSVVVTALQVLLNV